jgi:hypothetical protein
MAQHPNMWLQPLSHAKENRPLREAKHLWKKAGQLLIAERLRLNTMHLSALLVQEKVLANVWWSFVLAKKARVKDVQKALVLWLNSTLGFLLLLGHREETEGAWVDFKKPTLEAMPVLNIEQASPRQIKSLAAAYDELAQKKLCPFQEMQTDPVRAAIDKAITQTLQLPDLSNLRQLLAREPIVCLTLGRLLGGTASRA